MSGHDEEDRGLSPFAPDFDRIRRVRACKSATIADLAREAGLDPATDFRFADWSDVDWRGSDLRQYDLTGALYSLPERTNISVAAEAIDDQKADSAAMRIVSGIQPTSSLHLGNYLGIIPRWVKMQEASECFIFVADLHAISIYNNPADLAADIREMAATLIACGLDPGRVTMFNQARVSAHAELAWILNCTAPLGWLNRMRQSQEESGKDREGASVGLYTYPVLQAADVLLYQATHVPIGEDQEQHIELIRDIATKFNMDYAEIFALPEAQIDPSGVRAMSLRDGTVRMSKSDKSDMSRINLTDDPDRIMQKIRKAKTDSKPLPDMIEMLDGRPEAKNLVTIYAALAGETAADVLARFTGQGFGAFKSALTELIVETLGPIRARLTELLDDPAQIEAILASGAETAATVGAPTIEAAYHAVGLQR